MQRNSHFLMTKLSIPGTRSDELCFLFLEDLKEQHIGSGYVFGVFQIRSSSDLYHDVIGKVVKHFLDFYTRSGESRSKRRGSVDPFDNPGILFENALKYTSEHMSPFLQEANRDPEFDLRKVSLLLGAADKNEVFVSTLGDTIRAFLLYPVLNGGGFSHYTIVDVLGDQASAPSFGEKEKFFTNIISGELTAPGSTLVVCNERFFEYISIDQIKQVATNYPFNKLSDYFERLLGKANSSADFNALFLSLQDQSVSSAGAHPQIDSNVSMEGLVSREKSTERILSPAAFAQAKSWALIVWQAARRYATKVLTFITSLDYARAWSAVKGFAVSAFDFVRSAGFSGASRGKDVPEKRTSRKSSVSKTKKKVSKTSPASTKTTTTSTKAKVNVLPEALVDSVTSFAQDIPDRFSSLKKEWTPRFAGAPAYLKSRFLALSPLSRGLLLLSCIFLILFAVSIVGLQRGRSVDTALQNYEELVSDVRQKTNQAEASIIYDDEDRAVALLAEAEALLATLPQTSTSEVTTFQELTEELEAARKRIARIFITQETLIGDLSTQIPSLSSARFVRSGANVFIYSSDAVYSLNTTSAQVTQLSPEIEVSSLSCGESLDDSTIYLCDEDNVLYELDIAASELSRSRISLDEEVTMADIAFYNNRIYVLDSQGGTIYRHAGRSGGGFAGGFDWLRDKNITLEGATDLTIDGSIYILKGPTEIIKATAGSPEPFSLPVIEPALSNVDALWTREGSDYLYLFDLKGGRIIVYDKATNAAKAQVLSDSLSSFQDVIVLEEERAFLVISDGKLYRLSMDYLQ